MITIVDVKDWLKEHIDAPSWYAGSKRAEKEKTITVLNGNSFDKHFAIGGVNNTSYQSKGARILVSWDKRSDSSEKKALEIYRLLERQEKDNKPFYINNKRVVKITMRDPEPIYLGTTADMIFEYVIDIEIIIER